MTRLLTLARSGRQKSRLDQATITLREAAEFTADLATGRLITVDAYMRQRGIADEDFIRRYASPLGKTVKEAYTRQKAAEPPRTWELRKGSGLLNFKVVRPAVYQPDEPALAEGWNTYARTAALGKATEQAVQRQPEGGAA